MSERCGRGPRGRHRHGEDRVRADSAFVRRAVDLDHLAIDRGLIARIHALQRRAEFACDELGGFASALSRDSASCRRRAARLLRARRSMRRRGRRRGPCLPSARKTSASTVGLPRESRISLPMTLTISMCELSLSLFVLGETSLWHDAARHSLHTLPVMPRFAHTIVFIVVAAVHALSPVGASYDSRWTVPVVVSLLERGDTDIDEYAALIEPDNQYSVVKAGGHLYNWYPIGGPLLAVPVVVAIQGSSMLAGPILERTGRESFHALARGDLVVAEVWWRCWQPQSSSLPRRHCCLQSRNAIFRCGPRFLWSPRSHSEVQRGPRGAGPFWQHTPSMLLLTITLWIAIRAINHPRIIQFAAIPLAISLRPSNQRGRDSRIYDLCRSGVSRVPVTVLGLGGAFCRRSRRISSLRLWTDPSQLLSAHAEGRSRLLLAYSTRRIARKPIARAVVVHAVDRLRRAGRGSRLETGLAGPATPLDRRDSCPSRADAVVLHRILVRRSLLRSTAVHRVDAVLRVSADPCIPHQAVSGSQRGLIRGASVFMSRSRPRCVDPDGYRWNIDPVNVDIAPARLWEWSIRSSSVASETGI